MLEARGVRKTYGGVVALAGADFTVRAGSVHALLGENGAGKSTLVKIIAGALTPDAGTVRLDDEEVNFGTTAEAVRHGVAVVSQELNVFPDLDVLANLFTLREPRRGPFVNRAEMAARGAAGRRRARPRRRPAHPGRRAQPRPAPAGRDRQGAADRPADPDPRRADLRAGRASTGTLLEILRVLRDREVGVVFVSHILEDVMALCDEVTVLRDGEVTMAAEPREGLTVSTIVTAMLGKPPEEAEKEAAEKPDAELAEQVADALEAAAAAGSRSATSAPAGGCTTSTCGWRPGDRRSRRRRGRRPPRGARARERDAPPDAGLGRAARRPTCRPASGGRSRSGVALVTGDRRRLGLMLDKPIWENIGQIRSVGLAADGPIVRAGALRARAREHVDGLRIRSRSVDQAAGSLSGGNQQKVVFAKWLDAQPSVFLLDDPTRGVDVGAKDEMHALIRSTAAAGAPVLICSTDIDELASLCDRVVVLPPGPRVGRARRRGAEHPRGPRGHEHRRLGIERRVLRDDDLEQQRRRSRSASVGELASSRSSSSSWVVDADARRSPERGPSRRCRRSRSRGHGPRLPLRSASRSMIA